MGVPNARARISDIKIGNVWKPSQIAAHVPSVDVSSGLRAMAAARRAAGDAQAARAKADAAASAAWAKGIDSLVSAAGTIVKACAQSYAALDERYIKSAVKNQAYKDACLEDPTKYNAETAKFLAQDEANNLARRNSLGFMRTTSEEITNEMVKENWLKTLPTDKGESKADDKTFDLKQRIEANDVLEHKDMLNLYDSTKDGVLA